MRKSKGILFAVIGIITSMITNYASQGIIVNAETSPNISINIDTSSENSAISPYIYGLNITSSNDRNLVNNTTVNARRQGGNRFTAYNWETDASNAGADYKYQNDGWLYSLYQVPTANIGQPAAVVSSFHDKNLSDKVPYSLVTLQAAGFAAGDMTGPVASSDYGSTTRFKKVKAKKDSALSLTPDTSDDTVYMDEYVNYLVNKYGKASSSTGIKGYSIDNEPSYWRNTHPEVHSAALTCSEIIDKTVNLSKAVKSVDSSAEVFGPALYGFEAFKNLRAASDWNTVNSSKKYNWFIDYYLDSTKKASDTEGKRLVDVLDLHWYPEAKGGGKRIIYSGNDSDYSNIDCNKARMQAPRTLWDPTYTENSYLGQYNKSYLPLLTKVQQSIDKYNPGTKLAFTEYNYGGENHISGGIAQADVFGIFAKYGVYLSTFWQFEVKTDSKYIQSALNLYTNYDGNGSKYGDTNVKCETSDNQNSSAYSSIVKGDDGKLHIVLLNKNYDSSQTFNFNIKSSNNYISGNVFGFDQNSSEITKRDAINNIVGNKFTYTVPPLTALHIVLDTDSKVIYGDINEDKTINENDYLLMRKMLLNRKNYGYKREADLNGDGRFNILDYLILKRFLAGNIKTLPINRH